MTKTEKAMNARVNILKGSLTPTQLQQKAEILRRKMDESSQKVQAA